MSKKKRLIYLPLGGAGEIGMNMYVYGYGPCDKEDLIVVDAGVSFPNMDTTPGVDLIMPDISYLKENIGRVKGIFITHAHEDHVGALGYLFSGLEVPIFCRSFTGEIADQKLSKIDLNCNKVSIVNVYPQTVKVGHFIVSFLPIAHSIPEAASLIIDTPIGRLIHTGDFKIDTTPVLGDPFNENIFKKISGSGILALVCDSTNIYSERPGRSESSIRSDLYNLIKSEKGMVVATTFASNLARLLTLAECARDAGREVLVLGRAMHSMISVARSQGILDNFPNTIQVEDVRNIERSKLFILATGSQGEKRAASAQLAKEKYMNVVLNQGDCFLFSSKTIPGNEIAVSEVVNNLISRGVKVIDDSSDLYHVSGHANRPDLERLHKICEPKVIIPMHGENRHLWGHHSLACDLGINSFVIKNGVMIEIKTDGTIKIAKEVVSGRQFLDGGNLISASDNIVKTRIHMAIRGHISVSILIEDTKLLANGVWVKSKGLPAINSELLELEDLIEDEIVQNLSDLSESDLKRDENLEIIVKRTVNRLCGKYLNKKPVVTIFINRLD